jgi:hypothetical protein
LGPAENTAKFSYSATGGIMTVTFSASSVAGTGLIQH